MGLFDQLLTIIWFRILQHPPTVASRPTHICLTTRRHPQIVSSLIALAASWPPTQLSSLIALAALKPTTHLDPSYLPPFRLLRFNLIKVVVSSALLQDGVLPVPSQWKIFRERKDPPYHHHRSVPLLAHIINIAIISQAFRFVISITLLSTRCRTSPSLFFCYHVLYISSVLYLCWFQSIWLSMVGRTRCRN